MNKNYCPVQSQGYHINLLHAKEPCRTWHNKAKYELAEIYLFPFFPDLNTNNLAFGTHYMLMKANGQIDYDLITSKN